MPAKPVVISSRARFEMTRRGISPTEIVRMIRSPRQVVPSVKGRAN
jgi:hypothetical protein